MKVVLAVLAVIVGVLALGWVSQGNDFMLYRYFAPKYEATRRQVFEQTKSYNQGMVQELQNMQFQYEQANDEQKVALASIILHRAADFDEDRLPADLRSFIQKLRLSR
jgi:hypothetical protein